MRAFVHAWMHGPASCCVEPGITLPPIPFPPDVHTPHRHRHRRRRPHPLQHLMDDAARCEVLHKARTIGEASQAMTKAVLQTYLAPFSRSRSQREQQRGAGTPFSSIHDR